MRRKAVALGILAAGVFGALAFFRRAHGGRQEHVDVFYADGVRLTLTDVEAAPLLVLARDALQR